MPTHSAREQAKTKREAVQLVAAAAERRGRRIQILAGTVFAGIVAVVLVVIIAGGGNKRSGIGVDGKAKLAGVPETATLLRGVKQSGLTLGDPTAPVTILELLDVQCPYCRAHELDEQPTIINQLVRTGKAQLKAQPVALPMMGEDSEAGRAIALRLSHINKTWNFLNLFYFNQGDERTGYVTPGFLDRIISAIPGATPADARRTIDARDKPLLDEIEQTNKIQAQKASDAGEQYGTPFFAIAKTGSPLKDFKPVFLNTSARNSTVLIEAVDALIAKDAKTGDARGPREARS